MRFFIFFIWLFVSIHLSYAKEFVTQVNQPINISIPANSSLSISNSKIMNWKDKGHYIKVFPLKVGSSFIKTQTQNNQLTILSKEDYLLYKSLLPWIKNKLGLKIFFSNGGLIIAGNLYRSSDWLNIAKLAKTHNASYLFKAKIDNDIKLELQNYFSNKLKNFNYASPHIELSPVPTLLRLSNKNTNLIDNTFKKYGFLINEIKNSMQQVTFQISFINISKSIQKQFGLIWSSDIKAQILPEYLNQNLLSAMFNTEQNSGELNLLSKAQIPCNDGKTCEIYEGGEIPIKSKAFSYTNISWKPYGLTIKLQPKLSFNNKVALNINYQLSYPDFSESIDNLPSFKQKKIQSNIVLVNNQSQLISGLSLNSKGKNRVNPWVPILNPIFKYLLSNSNNKTSHSNLFLMIKASYN